jgi:hypothetical protein
MRDELIEGLIARAHLRRVDHATEEAVARKFLIEEERTGADALADSCEALARCQEVLSRGCASDRGPIPNAIEDKIKLDAVVGLGPDPSSAETSVVQDYISRFARHVDKKHANYEYLDRCISA